MHIYNIHAARVGIIMSHEDMDELRAALGHINVDDEGLFTLADLGDERPADPSSIARANGNPVYKLFQLLKQHQEASRK